VVALAVIDIVADKPAEFIYTLLNATIVKMWHTYVQVHVYIPPS
jgi:hypothetical protein